MMNKICTGCHEEKPIDQFHKRQYNEDGYNHRCKVCVNEYNLKRIKTREEGQVYMKMSALRKCDWCEMYNLMKGMGYDPELDLHSQFAAKYNLKPKKRWYKNHLSYTWKDCLERPDETNPSTN